MNRVIKFLYKTSFGLSILILSLVFVMALGNVYASNFTFEKVQITNDGTVNNNIHTNSNTGNNTTTDNGGSATVQTGDAGSQTTIQNNVNTNIINTGCNCTPTPAPTNVPAPTATLTPGQNNGGGNNGGGGSSGSSNSSSSNTAGNSSSTQAVLGTMAGTGTFEQNLMNLFSVAGLGLIAFSSLKLKKVL